MKFIQNKKKRKMENASNFSFFTGTFWVGIKETDVC